MRVGFDISPLTSDHQVRGVGFYTQRLRDQLKAISQEKDNFELVEFAASFPKRVDLVHYPYFQPFFLTLPLFKISPMVVTIHDLVPLKFPRAFPPGKRGRLKWQIQKIALNGVRVIITDSEFSKKDITKLAGIPAAKIFVIYLAADAEFKVVHNQRYLEKLKNRYHLPEKFFLYVGDLNWNKNVTMLTRACLDLGYPLVVVGKQAVSTSFDLLHPENQEIVAFQELAQQNATFIIRLGFVPTEDLVGIYNLAAGYVHPSLAEGFGLPILEAMACGCPVITSRMTSLAEIAGNAAWLVDPKNIKELETGLKTFWQKIGVRRRYVSLGLKRAGDFSWRKTAEATLAVYRQVYEKKI